jgi:rod shape-determining protein MreC
MHWIIRFIVYHRNLTWLAVTVCLCLMMLTSNTTRQSRISRALTFTVFYPFQFYVSQTARIKNIFAENRKLKEEIAAQSVTISLLKEAALETGRLEALLQLENDITYDLSVARVVAREPAYISRSVVITVGTDNDVMPFMPAINSRGVVGKVIQSTRHMALVQLLIDPSNRTGVLIQRTREVGILETENGDDFFIRCRTHADVNPGDTVVTSGLGGVYPKGLTVGVISKIRENHDPLFKKVVVDLSVDFNRLEEVFVMRVHSQWSSFRAEIDSLERAR